jgi:phenylacetate-CoA ligase
MSLICRYAIAPAWACWEGSAYLKHYRELCRTQWDALEVIRRRQLEKLKALVAHAAATVPYYRRLFTQLRLRPEDIQSFDDLRQIPVLSKQDLRDRADDLLSEAYRGQRLHVKKTSGSTGVPLTVLLDDAGMQFKRACTLRSDEWSGWRLGERVAKVWGNPEYRHGGWRGWLRNRLLERADYLDTLHLDDNALRSFAQRLRRTQPSLIFGHAHSVYLLAQYVAKHGPKGIRPQGILTTAMVLHPWQRQAIEETFRCRVINRYGCEEVSLIACECEHQQGLHINADGVYVEIISQGRPAAEGQAGAVVLTDLVNRAMPIIRYKVGDVAALSSRRCACGRGLPLLDRLEGREADYVTTEKGELISGISLTENFALKVPGIAQMQIIQESRTFFRFRVVPSPSFGEESLQELARLVKERFGEGTAYELEYVEAIPPEPSGKYRFCISKVPVSL